MTAIPIEVGPDEARDAAVRELSDPAYRAAEPSLFDRIVGWIFDRIAGLFGSFESIGPGGFAGLVLLALLVVLVVVLVRLRVGKVARARRHRSELFDARVLTADDHRRAAELAVSRGELAEAVRERFRAIVRELERRGLLDEVSGATVAEIATHAGRTLPASAAELLAVARIFDDVVYGDRPATMDGYQRLVALDTRIQTERPALLGASS